MAFAAQAHERSVHKRANEERRRHRSTKYDQETPRRVNKSAADEPLSTIERQVLAGLELDLTQGAIARNLRISEDRVEEIVGILRKKKWL